MAAENLLDAEEKFEAIYLPLYYHAEVNAAKRLNLNRQTPSKIVYRMKNEDRDSYLADLAEQNQVELTDQQQGAVWAALSDKVSVLTGGPGTGKTTTLRMVINALDEEEFSYALASPTGRAAKRLSEATDREAMTIHRLLKWTPGEGFVHNEEAPLETDFVIIDEASMLDVLLFPEFAQGDSPQFAPHAGGRC